MEPGEQLLTHLGTSMILWLHASRVDIHSTVSKYSIATIGTMSYSVASSLNYTKPLSTAKAEYGHNFPMSPPHVSGIL